MSHYRGRFAPSPTGRLHFGSLFAAVISYLHARIHQGEWLLRIEDIDPLREQGDAKQAIIDSLLLHGLIPDAPPVYQSTRSELYERTLSRLSKSGAIYPCPCSRKYLHASGGIHLPACQHHMLADTSCALKFKTAAHDFSWHDLFQGQQHHALTEDFVLKRKEGFYAYQLAVVCDDIDQGITHVIRGYDLLASTPMQLALYKALNVPPPQFGHFPVITGSNGQKLSKQNLAPAVNDQTALSNLLEVFSMLNIAISSDVHSCSDALEKACLSWAPDYLSGKSEILQPKLL
jgi:glutamyl-Q tRNA(Asp) synthetase